MVSLINLCIEFNKFPREGGLLDQDACFMHVLQNAMIWRQQRQELDQAQADAKAKAKSRNV